MKIRSLAIFSVLLCSVGVAPVVLWAGPPNVVLSRPLHFSSGDGTSITLAPGKYLIEQAGPAELRVTPDGSKASFTIRAESLSHEQYELFSPMALTRPQKEDEFLIELLLPGGTRLVARGSTNAPAAPSTITKAPAPPPTPLTLEKEDAEMATHQDPASLPSNQGNTPKTLSPGDSTPELSSSLDTSLPYQAPVGSAQGTRVVVDEQEPGKDTLYLSVLSPDHVGLTMFEQPALFWFIAQLTSQPVDVMVMDEGNTQILLDVRMLPPIHPGIHKVELKDYGIRLQLNTTYQWKIMLQGNSPDEKFSTSGWIRRIPPPANLTSFAHFSSINSIPPRPLVEAGLWYDALWVLSERIQTHPIDMTALQQRANLFEQVGLLPPAQQDRSHLRLP